MSTQPSRIIPREELAAFIPAGVGALRHGLLWRIAARLEYQQSSRRDWVLAETQVKWFLYGRSFVHQHLRECRLVKVLLCRPGWPIQHEPRAHPRPELDSIFALETQARALAGDLPPNTA